MSKSIPETINPLIPKLNGPDKSVKFNSHVISLHAYAATRAKSLNKLGMAAFYLHLSDAELAARHPGVIRAVAPVRPINKPDYNTFQGSKAEFRILREIYNSDLEESNTYEQGKQDVELAWLNSLDESDTDVLRDRDPINGLLNISAEKVYEYLKTNYGSLSQEAFENLKFKIEADLNPSRSIQENINDMVSARARLTASGRSYYDHQMYEALKSKLMKNSLTKEIANDYITTAGFDLNNPNFEAYMPFVIRQFSLRGYNLGVAALLNSTDNPVQTPANTTPTVPSPVTMAAHNLSSDMEMISKAELKELRKLASAAAPSTNKRTGKKGKNRTGAPQPTKPAPGWCILCGYGTHGPNLTRADGSLALCNILADQNGNPRPGYHIDQVMCKNPVGGPVHGLIRSPRVQNGFHKP